MIFAALSIRLFGVKRSFDRIRIRLWQPKKRNFSLYWNLKNLNSMKSLLKERNHADLDIYFWVNHPPLSAWRTVHSALLPGAGFDFDSHNKGTFHSRLSGTIAQDFIWPQIPNSVTFRGMGILKISSMSLIWPNSTKVEFTSFYQFPMYNYLRASTLQFLHISPVARIGKFGNI